MGQAVILEGARTPFGRLGGGLASLSAVELGTIAAREAMTRSGLEPDDIDHLIIGQVLQAGSGQIPSRQVGFNIGLASTVTSDTINRVCGSGMRAVTLADLFVRAGEYRTIIAGGMESMSNAPYLLKNARFGYRMGNGELIDSMVDDGLTCAVDRVHMGIHGSNVAAENECSREVQDEYAYRSHIKAHEAYEAGRLQEELVPVEVPGRRGQVTVVERDEAIRPDTTVEALSKLRPVFDPEGSVTAGNAPGVNDGAAAMVVTSEEWAQERGIKPLAKIVAHATSAWDVPYLAYTPHLAAEAALQKAGLKISDMDVIEINEAFASVAVISSRRLGIDPDDINPNGGAIALGHPIGASGARLVLTLAYELRRRGGGYGLAAICSGGAQGDAIILRVD
ncbi:MAG TPA: acetyl-CoA C-acetyltransferase [Thermomicrobiales bacterium]|nr:acetyl-CoA C-acetyltransferase [Thermomicrobiales bacterium]